MKLRNIHSYLQSLPVSVTPRTEISIAPPEIVQIDVLRINSPSHQYVYQLIKPLIGFREDMESRLDTFPFESNVFLMMKFREENQGISDFIVKTLGEYGLSGIRADDPNWNITNNVYNPVAVLYCCKYGIALFDEAEAGQAYSPNVAYELAMMHYQQKNCLILKHSELPNVPFDLVKDLYSVYSKEQGIKNHITRWVKEITHN